MKGWVKKGGKNKKREGSPETGARKKNWTGKDGKVAKCFKCACDHDDDCKCPCTFHLPNMCTGKKARPQEKKADMTMLLEKISKDC